MRAFPGFSLQASIVERVLAARALFERELAEKRSQPTSLLVALA